MIIKGRMSYILLKRDNVLNPELHLKVWLIMENRSWRVYNYYERKELHWKPACIVRKSCTAISLTNPHAIFTSRLSEGYILGYTRSAGSVDMIVTWLYVREPRNRTSGS